MAKIEKGSGKLISVDTEKKTLKIQELPDVITVSRGGELAEKPKERDYPYNLEWESQEFYQFVGKKVEYVLVDGAVASLGYPS